MNKDRLPEIDFTRTLAIMLMVFTHTAMFFYDFGNPAFNFLSDLGGFVCFTIFLFDSAAVVPGMVQKYGSRTTSKKLFVRGLKLLAIYILFALIINGPQRLLYALTLVEIPLFADFILAFALFLGLGAALTFVIKNKHHALVALAISIGLALAGAQLYHYSVWPIFTPLKALLVGDGQAHVFPLLQYLPIYVAGIAYAYWRPVFKLPQLIALNVFLGVLTYAAIAYTGFMRWQAAPGFLLYGLSANFLFILCWQVLNELLNQRAKIWEKLMTVMANLSNAAFGILIWHVLLIVSLSWATDMRFDYLVSTLIWLIVLTVSFVAGRRLKL